MLQIETRYEHIVLDDLGVPVIAATQTKVIELVLDKIAYGWSPEEMHVQHPYLSLGEIHSALAYYWDHQEELEREIQRRLELVESMRRHSVEPPLIERLRAEGLIR